MNTSKHGTYQGIAWQYGNDSARFPAKLTVSEQGIDIELFGKTDIPEDPSEAPPVNLVGEFFSLGPVSLWKCLSRGTSSYQATEKSDEMYATEFSVTRGYIGLLIELLGPDQEPTFHKLRLTVSHLDAWIRTTGLNRSRVDGDVVLNYKSPERKTWGFGDVNLSIGIGYTMSPALHSFSLSESVYITFESSNARAITEWITEFVDPFIKFQTLGMGVAPSVETLEVVCPREMGNNFHDAPYSVMMPNWHSGEQLSPVWAFNSQHFGFGHDNDNFHSKFQRWLDIYTDLKDVIDLYLLAKHRSDDLPYFQAGFVYAAQACEMFHYIQYKTGVMTQSQARKIIERAKEPFEGDTRLRIGLALAGFHRFTFKERLLELFAEHRALLSLKYGDLETLADDVKATRNYFVHFAPELAKKQMDHAETLSAKHALTCILTAGLLEIVGMTRDDAHEVVQRTQDYQAIGSYRVI